MNKMLLMKLTIEKRP